MGIHRWPLSGAAEAGLLGDLRAGTSVLIVNVSTQGTQGSIAGIVLPGPVYFLRLKVRVLWILDAGTEAWDLVSAL